MKNYTEIDIGKAKLQNSIMLQDITNIKRIFRHNSEAVMILEVSSRFTLNPDSNIVFANEYKCNMLLVICTEEENCIVNCISSNRRIRALEFMDYLFGKYGITDGNIQTAKGKVSKVILEVHISETETNGITDYFLRRVNDYFTGTKIINCMIDNVSIDGMKKYHKKSMPWAFVKTVDICPKGNRICVKSLENTTGTIITSDDEVYIMIGNRGEVYDIRKNKFYSSYESTNETLDVFALMPDSIPTVIDINNGNCISIDELAHICYPKQENGIFARELTERTKVFGMNNNLDYFIGKKGDYMAVRADDLQDVYIIKKEIFYSTYEMEECNYD